MIILLHYTSRNHAIVVGLLFEINDAFSPPPFISTFVSRLRGVRGVRIYVPQSITPAGKLSLFRARFRLRWSKFLRDCNFGVGRLSLLRALYVYVCMPLRIFLPIANLGTSKIVSRMEIGRTESERGSNAAEAAAATCRARLRPTHFFRVSATGFLIQFGDSSK